MIQGPFKEGPNPYSCPQMPNDETSDIGHLNL